MPIYNPMFSEKSTKVMQLTEGHRGVTMNLFTVYALDQAATVIVMNITWSEVVAKGYNNTSKYDCMRTATKQCWDSEKE